jgi:hypothetical protein
MSSSLELRQVLLSFSCLKTSFGKLDLTIKGQRRPFTGPQTTSKVLNICRGLCDRDIDGLIGYRQPNKLKGYLAKHFCTYDKEQDVYLYPEGQALAYATQT